MKFRVTVTLDVEMEEDEDEGTVKAMVGTTALMSLYELVPTFFKEVRMESADVKALK